MIFDPHSDNAPPQNGGGLNAPAGNELDGPVTELNSGRRRLTYMRLSVTDLCNLRCRYCMPPDGVPKLGHADILTYEEMYRLAAVGSGLGLKKLRLTGGEPLVRKGLVDFIHRMNAAGLFQVLRLTTNGVLLAEMAADLKSAGVSGLNISLDAVTPSVYAVMAGLDGAAGAQMAARAWAGFRAAVAGGFNVKINCVPIRGGNDGEIEALARLVFDYPVDVRFIEHMPIGAGGLWDKAAFMPSAEILERFEKAFGKLETVEAEDKSAPAKLFVPKGALGRLGLISPVSGHFCADCNRIRLTADGRLKPCLLTNREIDVRGPLRAGASDEELRLIFLKAASFKPTNYLDAEAEGLGGGQGRGMSSIGG